MRQQPAPRGAHPLPLWVEQGCHLLPSLPGPGACVPSTFLALVRITQKPLLRKLQKHDHCLSSPVPRSGLCQDQATVPSPHPQPLANLGLRHVRRVGGVEKGGRDAVATSLFLSCLHPTLSGSGSKGRATRWPGGGAVSAARIPLPQSPALPPSLRSLLVALLLAQAVRKEEQVLEGYGSALG